MILQAKRLAKQVGTRVNIITPKKKRFKDYQ